MKAAFFLLLAAQLGTGTPKLLFFSGPWCGACAAMEPTWQSFVRQPPGQIQTIYIDVDQPDSPAYLQYRSFWEEDRAMPIVIWVDAQGRVRERHQGTLDLAELQRKTRAHFDL